MLFSPGGSIEYFGRFGTAMELKVIIWIIIGLFYLISRFRKKPAPPTAQQGQREAAPDTTSQPNRPMTFEELLREIEGTKKAPEPVPQPKQSWESEAYDYEDEPVPEKKPLEDVNYDYRKEDNIYETYEKAKNEAFYRPSLEETSRLEDTIVRFKEFKPYDQEKKKSLATEYIQELKNPSSFRKAFILSEILNRKF
jgi:hypothetical protein